MTAEPSVDFLSQMPEVARQALTFLRGSPLSLPERSHRELIDLLSLAEDDLLLRETYGLLCLGKWLFDAGQTEACLQVMDLANSATSRLEDRNAAMAVAMEGFKKEIDKKLGTSAADKTAPRYGESGPEGSVSLRSLTSHIPRKLV